MTDAFTIRAALSCGKQSCPCSQRGTLTHCCAHSDGHPSLSVRDGQTAPLVTCQTGCSQESVIAALKARNLWPVREQREQTRQWEPNKVYRYVDEEGVLVAEKGRFEWTDRETGQRRKRFLWRPPGREKWGNLDGIRVEDLPLFNLHGVLRNPEAPVWFVEGEKAAEACIFRGLVAVALAGGASQREFGDALLWLQGREVILWPDHDAEGWGLMGRLLFHLPQARLIRLEGGKGFDAADYFEAGGTLDRLASATGHRIDRQPIDMAGWRALYRGEVSL